MYIVMITASGRSSTCGEVGNVESSRLEVRAHEQQQQQQTTDEQHTMTAKGSTWTLQMQCRLLWALVEYLPDESTSSTDIDGRQCIALVQVILLLIPDWTDTDSNREQCVELLTKIIDKLVDSLHLSDVSDYG
jgi:hypothetical protein